MSVPWSVAQIEPEGFSPAQWQALHRLRVEVDREELPDDEPEHLDEMVAELTIDHPSQRSRRWVAWSEDRAIGYAFVNVDLVDNLHLAWSWVCVSPSRRREGLGAALLRLVVEGAEAEQRSSLGIDFRPGTAGAIVAGRFGFEDKALEHHNRTHVAAIDQPMIDEWVVRASERAVGYSLRTWTAPTPDDALAEYARVFEVMNTAPRDDLDMEDRHMTADLMREREAQLPARGVEKWVTCAVSPDRSFAGFTELFFSRWRTDVCYQGNTGVDPAHRDRGLGRWLKAAMYNRLREERPAIAKIDTWNAGSNKPMLAINHAMGFAPVNEWVNAQAAVEVVKARLEPGR